MRAVKQMDLNPYKPGILMKPQKISIQLTYNQDRTWSSISIKDYIHSVDTVFGHVSLDEYLELMRCKSAGRDVVTSLQKSCRWGLVPMRKRQSMAKSKSGDGFVPMTGADGCRWLWEMVCRWSWKKGVGVVDRFMVVYRSVVGHNLMLSIVVGVCFVYRFYLIWNSSPSRVWL